MMSSTMSTSRPSIDDERSLRMRTRPDDSVAAPPYELTSMRSIVTGIEMARMRSAMNGSEPFRTLTRVSSRPA